jgi:hypothetical protein
MLMYAILHGNVCFKVFPPSRNSETLPLVQHQNLEKLLGNKGLALNFIFLQYVSLFDLKECDATVSTCPDTFYTHNFPYWIN